MYTQPVSLVTFILYSFNNAKLSFVLVLPTDLMPAYDFIFEGFAFTFHSFIIKNYCIHVQSENRHLNVANYIQTGSIV